MSSTEDTGDELTQSLSLDDFQKQASLMTNCTLLWKELSDHFTSLEHNLREKSDALKLKLETLNSQTHQSLRILEMRESTIDESISIALRQVQDRKDAAMAALDSGPKIGDSDDLLLNLRSFCAKMDSGGFWKFLGRKKKELETIRAKIPVALSDCIDPAKFVLEAISEVFPGSNGDTKKDMGWVCILLLESLIPMMTDPILGSERMLVTPGVKETATEMAETWKNRLDEGGGIENVKNDEVHTFLQHLVTFGIVKEEDVDFYGKLVVRSARRKQISKLAVALGLSHKMPDIIEELIDRGQQVDAVHFTYEFGLLDNFPPVPLLKSFLKDAKMAASSIFEDPNNPDRATHPAVKKEQSALRAVIKCIEDYKLEAELPPDNLKNRLKQLEKAKTEKKKTAPIPATKRSRANNHVCLMPPSKAGRFTDVYVSSFPADTPLDSEASLPVFGPGNGSPQVYSGDYSPETAPPPPEIQ